MDEEPGNLWFMFKVSGQDCAFPTSRKRQTDGVSSWFMWVNSQNVLAD